MEFTKAKLDAVTVYITKWFQQHKTLTTLRNTLFFV